MGNKLQSQLEKHKVAAVAALVAAVCLVMFYHHTVLHMGKVVTHFFYVPVILASFWWKRKGLIVAVVVAALLILSHIFLRRDVTTLDDYFRAGMLVVISYIVGVLSEQIAAAKNQISQHARQLSKRVKELHCCYGISKVVEKHGTSLETVFQEIVNLIPSAWQYPDIACARISIRGGEFATENFKQTHWKQQSSIKAGGKCVGALEVCYLQEKPPSYEGPFLKEERRLVDAIAERLGRIIERTRAEQEARRHQAEVAHLSRLSTVGQMASGFAHELNQPLCAITTFTDGCVRMIKSGAADSNELCEAMEQVAAEAHRAGKIIRHLRNFVEKRKLDRSPADITRIIQEATTLIEAEARQNDVAIRLELPAKAPAVLADVIQIEQVILNLARNSFEAMQAAEAGKRELTIRVSIPGSGAVEVSVSDTGKGLGGDEVERIFEPFFTTKPDGLGIGLSISRLIIEMHDGRLWADADAHRGATFRFTLPIAREIQ